MSHNSIQKTSSCSGRDLHASVDSCDCAHWILDSHYPTPVFRDMSEGPQRNQYFSRGYVSQSPRETNFQIFAIAKSFPIFHHVFFPREMQRKRDPDPTNIHSHDSEKKKKSLSSQRKLQTKEFSPFSYNV